MKVKITYKVRGMNFEASADNIAKAYEYVKAIIMANELSFPQQQEALSNYMVLLSGIETGERISHENHIFKIEKEA